MICGSIVSLRPIEADDLPLLAKWQNDPMIMAGWGLPSPHLSSATIAADLPGRFSEFDTAGYFMIEAEGLAVGRIGFEGLEDRHRCAELSLYIGEPDAQGKGFARDAVRALARYLFRERRAARVELTVIDSNTRARALYESLGFFDEGTLRGYLHFNGQYHDEHLMAVHSESDLR
jgi:RimJ/RimL family protein N-acetyltransferase